MDKIKKKGVLLFGDRLREAVREIPVKTRTIISRRCSQIEGNDVWSMTCHGECAISNIVPQLKGARYVEKHGCLQLVSRYMMGLMVALFE